MKKRLLAVLFAVVMVLALLPTAALAADTLPITWLPDGIIPFAYSDEAGRFIARDSKNSVYILDKTGAIVSTFTGYDNFPTFDKSTGWIKVEKDGKYGFIDQTGKVVIPLVYDDCWGFSEGLAIVSTGSYPNTKYGFINKSGQLIIPMDYDYVFDFSDGLAVVSQNGKCGYVDTTGKTVIPLVYDSANPFNGGVAVVGTGKDEASMKYGLIDTGGRLVLPLKYDELHNSGEILLATKDGTLGFIDRTDKVVVPFFTDYGFPGQQFMDFSSVSEGRIALFDKDHKTYYKDMTGKTVGGTYDFGGIFSEGLAYAEQSGRCGFIDTTGDFAFYIDVPSGFTMSPAGGDMGPSFNNGIAAIMLENRETGDTEVSLAAGVIDKQGNEIIPIQYEEAIMFDDNCGYVAKDGRCGIFFNPNAAAQPSTPTTPITPTQPTQKLADARDQKVVINGSKTLTFHAFGLKDAKGNYTNYVSVRDLAWAMSGGPGAFDVTWDGAAKAINLVTGKDYSNPTGKEGQVLFTGSQAYDQTPVKILVDGKEVKLELINIGGGNTYYKLRDLGAQLGFEVGWDQAAGAATITTK